MLLGSRANFNEIFITAIHNLIKHIVEQAIMFWGDQVPEKSVSDIGQNTETSDSEHNSDKIVCFFAWYSRWLNFM